MDSLTRQEGLAVAIPALMVYCKLVHKRYPALAEVHKVDTDLASEMSRLGYSEFTPALLEAMVMRNLQRDDTLKRMECKEITNFLRSDDVSNPTI